MEAMQRKARAARAEAAELRMKKLRMIRKPEIEDLDGIRLTVPLKGRMCLTTRPSTSCPWGRRARWCMCLGTAPPLRWSSSFSRTRRITTTLFPYKFPWRRTSANPPGSCREKRKARPLPRPDARRKPTGPVSALLRAAWAGRLQQRDGRIPLSPRATAWQGRAPALAAASGRRRAQRGKAEENFSNMKMNFNFIDIANALCKSPPTHQGKKHSSTFFNLLTRFSVRVMPLSANH